MEKFIQLTKLGAGEFEHFNGSLQKHLIATFEILKNWNAKDYVCDAGLYHAAYGTDGFDDKMISLNQRRAIADIIGSQAEKLVYLYCACDRDYFNDNFTSNLPYRDRFTNKKIQLDDSSIKEFCELTVANELEIAKKSSEFILQYGDELKILFNKMTPYLSKDAKVEIKNILY